MATHCCCLTAGGGVPLFVRSKPGVKPLPFPVVGSLNGVHLFAANQDVRLHSTVTDNYTIVWKVFHNSVTLILVSESALYNEPQMASVLDNLWNAMVLLYGLDDLTNVKSVERFKREIKISFSVMDILLGWSEIVTMSPYVPAVEMMVGPESHILQTFLDTFVEAANSPYGCLLVHNKVLAATHKWWELTCVELVLLATLLRSLPACSSRDVPIFLPDASPTVPHRLLTLQLVAGVEVCLICGPTPSLADLDREVGRFWRASLDVLKSVKTYHPRNFPPSFVLDPNILGFLLVNTRTHRCLYTVDPTERNSKKTGKMDPSQKLTLLKAFYKQVISSDTYWQNKSTAKDTPGSVTSSQAPLDEYIVTDTHKCYSSRVGTHVIVVLYSTAVPTYAMRLNM